MSAHVKESAFQNLGNFRFWNPESWALESRIPPTIGIQYLESRTSSRRGIGIIQDFLDFLTWGDIDMYSTMKYQMQISFYDSFPGITSIVKF